MIEDMESELTEAQKNDNLAVAEEVNVDEAVTVEAKARNEMEIYIK